MRKRTKRCLKCAEMLACYSGKKKISANRVVEYLVCNNGHKWRYINDALDAEVNADGWQKIVGLRANRHVDDTTRWPPIPGARNIMGRCWSGSE